MDRVIRVIALLCVAVLVQRALHWYPLLPDPFPIHFNGAGEADGWATKSPLAWALIPAVGMLLALGLWALARYTRIVAVRSPGLFNMPDKTRFLALNEQGRKAAVAPMASYLHTVSLLVMVLFLYIVEGIGRVATGMSATHLAWPVLVFVGGALGGLPFLLRATRKAIDQQG